MAYLPVEQQKEAIIHVGVIGLGMSHADVEAMIAKRGEDRLALNRLRVNLASKHRSACAQINRASERREADERAELALVKHDATRAQAALDRRAARDRQPLGKRIDRALAGLSASSSTIRAIRLDALRVSGASDTAPLPAVESPMDRRDVTDLLMGLAFITEQLELIYDAERGVAPSQDLVKLSGEAKDRMILTELRGVRSVVIAGAMPWLGKQRKVEMVRKEAGQRPVDGGELRTENAAV